MNNKGAKTRRPGIPGGGAASCLCCFVVQRLCVWFTLLLCGVAVCQDAGSFRGYVQRFDNTIAPCRKKADKLARKEKDVLVGVNYFPGWWKPQPNKWQDPRGEDWRARFPERIPLLGEYNDQETMNREIEAAARAGVGFFSILWYYNPPGQERAAATWR